jgi:hypothetical protein
MLDVAGTVNATNLLINGLPISLLSSPWIVNGDQSIYNYYQKNVGLGVNSPQAMLHVGGDVIVTGGVTIGNRTFSNTGTVSGNWIYSGTITANRFTDGTLVAQSGNLTGVNSIGVGSMTLSGVSIANAGSGTMNVEDVVFSSGNVIIPNNLNVSGNMVLSGSFSQTSGTNNMSGLTVSQNALFGLAGGNVGIGLLVPTRPLDV